MATGWAWARELVTDLGADQYVDLERESFEAAAGQVDLVLGLLGGDTLRRSWAVVRPGGALVSAVGDPNAADPGRPDVRAVFFVVAPDRAELVELAGRADAGQVRPVIGRVLPLADGRRAFEVKQAGGVPGKVVLAVSDQATPVDAR